MTLVPLFSIPYASTGNIDGPEYEHRGVCSALWVILDDDRKARWIEIVFAKPSAFRFRAAIFCNAENLSGISDRVCEVIESPWVSELQAIVHSHNNQSLFVMRHFIISIEGFGCLEVVAESAEMTEAAC